MSKTQVLIAGHGGQGVLLLADCIAYTAMKEGKHVAYTPSYGPETRGGKAKCYVIISEEEVDNPIIEIPDVEIIMNQPSMDFLNFLRPDGYILYNQSLIDRGLDREDVKGLAVPATGIADDLKQETIAKDIPDTKIFANSVMFGAFLELCSPTTSDDQVKETLKYFLGGKRAELITLNYLTIKKGREFLRDHAVQETSHSPFHCIPSWATQ